MGKIAYISGRYVPQCEAVTPIEDRGYQFSDGVYEYIAFYNQRILNAEAHMRRLMGSLEKLRIPPPMSEGALKCVMAEVIEKNGKPDGGLYLQVTRGVAKRDHPFPVDTKPVLSMCTFTAKLPKPYEIKDGVSVITQPDIRWGRCDIKTVSLLANVLAKQEASAYKAREAWLLRGDIVTEGAVSNAYIITQKEGVITHPEGTQILPGVTRNVALGLAREAGIPVIERPFTLSEAKAADEAFLTSTSVGVLSVVRIDGDKVGGGAPGDVTKKLMGLMSDHIFKQTGKRL